ncbi:hypothetical protein F2Q68_00017547 [Brassica cretica]|uniref:F-box domain-containing protein n=1 Tax=Brassica cretica TaxID=69181 RepID=A0A8S9HXN8_BRACR|nr:hypothetical protein F2Q68_00017547 [Brassica cretica]
MISDLPRDVAEEVLSWLPVTSLGRVLRSTCKKWKMRGKLVSLNHDPAALLMESTYLRSFTATVYCYASPKTSQTLELWFGTLIVGRQGPRDSYNVFDGFNSNSWKVVDVNPEWTIGHYHRGVSLKVNTYWFAEEKLSLVPRTEMSDLLSFLLCFDFTKERFGPRLPLPFHSFDDIDHI